MAPHQAPAQRLPFDLLLNIFQAVQALALDERGEYLIGNEVVGWDSYQEIAPFALVCRNWEEAAVAVLYQSVALVGGGAARRFLDTLERRPELASRVRFMAVGLEEQEDGAEGEGEEVEDWPTASEALVDVMYAVPNLDHLFMQPLHASVRPRLLAFFARPRRLKSLAVVGRDSPMGPHWAELLVPSDASSVLPGIERLSIDIWDPVPLAPRSAIAEVAVSKFPPLALTTLNCASTQSVLIPLVYIASSSGLLNASLYFEELCPAQRAADALTLAPKLRHLCYLSNPSLDDLETSYPAYVAANPIPTLDLALPSLVALETLAVSTTDLSSSFLALLPPQLRSVKIRAYSMHGFERPERVLEMLQDSRVNLKSLRELEVRDVGDEWPRELRRGIQEACRARGVVFRFVRDRVVIGEREEAEWETDEEGSEDENMQ